MAKTHSLANLETHFLKCRLMGHAWDDYIPVGKRKPPFGWRLSLLCTSCGTERHDLVGVREGDIISREYDYPDGYQLSFKMTREDARLEWKKRHRKSRTARRGDIVRLVQ